MNSQTTGLLVILQLGVSATRLPLVNLALEPASTQTKPCDVVSVLSPDSFDFSTLIILVINVFSFALHSAKAS